MKKIILLILVCIGYLYPQASNTIPRRVDTLETSVDSLYTKTSHIVNVKEFGAVGDGVANESAAFTNAIDYLQSLGGGTLIVPDGNYKISTHCIDTLTTPIKIVGDGDANILLRDGAYLLFRGQTISNPTLRDTLSRKDFTLYVSSTMGIAVGDLIYLTSPDTAETGWTYDLEDVHLIMNIPDDTTIVMAEYSNFNYKPSNTTIEIYRNQPLQIDNINFSVDYGSNVQIANMKDAVISNITFTDPAKLGGNDGMYFTRTFNSYAKNIYTSYLRYAIGVSNGSRNIYLSDITGFKNYHTVVPSGWCENVWVDGLTAQYCAGTIDAHPSFNIHYKNVVGTQEREVSNFRCLGGSLENIYLHSTNSAYQTYFVGLTTMSDPNIYYDYDYLIKNFEYVMPNADTKYDCMIGGSFFRNLTLDNVKVNYVEVGADPDSGNVFIHNSTIGSLRTRAKTVVMNSTFDASKMTPDLTGGISFANNNFPVSFYGCTFINYDSLLISDSNQDQIKSFIACRFDNITAFAKTYQFNTGEYNYHFINCDIDVDVWDSKIENSKTVAKYNTYRSAVLTDAEGSISDYLPLAGGTMLGTITSRTITPSSALTYDLGDTSHGYNIGYIRNIITTSSSYTRTNSEGSFYYFDLGNAVFREGTGANGGNVHFTGYAKFDNYGDPPKYASGVNLYAKSGELYAMDSDSNVIKLTNSLTEFHTFLNMAADDTAGFNHYDYATTYDSIKYWINPGDTVRIQMQHGTYANWTNLFSSATELVGEGTLTSFNDATIQTDKRVRIYFTYVSSNTANFDIKIYRKE